MAPVSSYVLKVAQGWRESLFKLGADVQRSHTQRLEVLARGVDLIHLNQYGFGVHLQSSYLREIAQNQGDGCVKGLRFELELEVNCNMMRCDVCAEAGVSPTFNDPVNQHLAHAWRHFTLNLSGNKN
jgi:hypothetical protein